MALTDTLTKRQRRRTGPLFVAGLVIFAGAVFLRFWKLSNIPGILGDESWYGLQALKLLSGGSIRWSTPTTPWLNPFYISLVTLAHVMLPPSEPALRLPAVLSGLAALAVNYFSARALFGRKTAAVSTLALAVLPVNIAYSRLGWDASQSPLFTIALFYSSLGIAAARKPGRFIFLAAVLYPAAVLVHAANALTFVFPLAAVSARYGRSAGSFMLAGKTHRRLLKWAVAAVCAGAALAIARPAVREFDRVFGSVQSHLADPRLCARAAKGFIDLLSGAGPYAYIAGVVHFAVARAVLVSLLAVASAAVFFRTYRHQGKTDRLLWCSLAAALAVFFAFTGAFALRPERERYALFLPAPIVLCTARSFVVAGAAVGRRKRAILTCAGLALALTFLGDFYCNVFRFIEATGGRSERQLVTGKTDPKFAALRHVLSQIPEGQPAHVLVEDWALRNAGQYLAHGRAGLHVREAPPPAEGSWKPTAEAPYWIITYPDGALEARLDDSIKRKLARKSFRSYDGRAAVVVLGPSSGTDAPGRPGPSI